MGAENNFRSSLELYNVKIEPKLKEIDIFLKENAVHSVLETANLLDVEQTEIENLCKLLNIKKIDNKSFILLMQNCSSYICKLLKREVECGSPKFYTSREISYIYNLDYDKVADAFKFLSFDKISSAQIKLILAQIT